MGYYENKVINAPESKKKIKGKPYHGVHISSTKKNPVNAMTNHPIFSPLDITKKTTSEQMADYIMSLPRWQEMHVVVTEKLEQWRKLQAKA